VQIYWPYGSSWDKTVGHFVFALWQRKGLAVALFTLLTLVGFPRIPMVWRHGKDVRQRRSPATSRHSFITTVWCYSILFSDWLLSL